MRMLIVEDDPALASLVQVVLESDGIRSRWAGSLAEADQALEAGGDLGFLLVDNDLPDGSGFSWLLRQLSAGPRFAGRAVGMTGRGPAGTGDLRDAGVPLLCKPFLPGELLHVVRTCLRTAGR